MSADLNTSGEMGVKTEQTDQQRASAKVLKVLVTQQFSCNYYAHLSLNFHPVCVCACVNFSSYNLA